MPLSRCDARRTSLFSVFLLAAACLLTNRSDAQRSRPPQVNYSSEVRDAERSLPQTISAKDAKLRASVAAGAGISVGVADFDGDGTKDLVTGYATPSGGALVVQRGSLAALAPTANEQAMLRAGQPVHPFVSAAQAIALPVRPDFLKVADVDFNGTQDVVVAAKGGSAAYLLRGDGGGGFLAPVSLPLSGALSALELWRNWDGSSLLAAGVCSASGCGLQVVDSTGAVKAFVPTAAAVTAITMEKFNNGALLDMAVLAGGSIQVVDAKTLLSGSPRVDTVPGANAVAIAGGFFVYDRRGLAQLAVLDASATLHILAREGTLDTTAPTREQVLEARHARKPVPYTRVKGLGMGWQEVETLPNVGGGASAGSTPLLLRGRLTTYAMEDLVVLTGGQYVQVSHKVDADGNLRVTTPVIAIDSTSAPVTAAVATRMSADPRYGVVMANLKPSPDYTVPSPYNTYYVTTTTDSNTLRTCGSGNNGTCSLRGAIALANADAASIGGKVDVIYLQAFTYTLSTQNNYADPYGDVNYHLNVGASVSFVGVGCTPTTGAPSSCSTIINANGATTGDNAMDINGGETNGGNSGLTPLHVYLSGIELENGKNTNNLATNGNAYNNEGGLIDFEGGGTGSLSMNNMILTSGQVNYGDAGAVFTSNLANQGSGASPVEIDNSLISNNKATEIGGALNLGFGSVNQPVILTSDTVSGNLASYTVNPSDPSSGANNGECGGLCIGQDETSTLTTITGTTFSGNTANGPGGAIQSQSGLSMSGSTVTGNIDNETDGPAAGGLFLSSGQPTDAAGAVTITTSTITSNSAPNATSGGGGIYIEPNTGGEEQSFAMHYSRIYGNTIKAGNATGLSIETGYTSDFTSFSATDNWWGCNGPASGTGCDTSNATSAGLSPYTTLALNLSTLTTYEGGSITATASLGQDSGGTVYSAANDTAYLTTPITTFTLTKTGTVTYDPSAMAFSSTSATATSYAAATATGTTNATGSGTATVVVDGETVTKTYSIIGPPTIMEGFSPTTVAPNANSTVTFTLGNPSGNGATVSGVAFSDTLPTNLMVSSPNGAATTCTSGTVTAAAGGSSISLSGASIAVGATCTVTVSVVSASIGSYTNTTGAVTASNGGTGGTASATLTVTVTPTKLVYTTPPASPITAGGNAGTVTVKLEDAAGNIATNNSTTVVTLTVTYPNSTTQTYMSTASQGVATFSGPAGVPLTAAGTYSYVASATGLTSASASEAVTAGPFVALAVSGLVSEGAPGFAQSATVEALDSYGNVVTSFTGTVTLTSTDPLATLSPASYTYTAADLGTHNFSVTLNTAGTQSVTATSSTVTKSVTGLVIGDAVLVINGNGTLSRLTNAGVATSPSGGYTGGGAPTASIAIDSAGDIFSVNPTTSKLAEFSKAGTALSGSGYSGGGISSPAAVAVDGLGTVWVANGNGTVSQFSNTGTALSPAGGYTTNSTAAAGGIAIDLSGNVWISTPTANTITEVLGGAAPVAPLAVSVTNVTTGARP